jgi:hypothetical protein
LHYPQLKEKYMDVKAIVIETQGTLQNAQFPMDKNQIMQKAQERGASDRVQQLVEELPDKQFSSVRDVVDNLPAGSLEEMEDY